VPLDKRFKTLRDLAMHLAFALLSRVAAARECVHALLELVCELTGVGCSSLLAPCRDRLMGSILGQALGNVPVATQISYVSVAAFFLQQNPPLVTMAALNKLVLDVVNAVERPPRLHQSRGELEMGQRLKVASIELMSAVLVSLEVRNSPVLFQNMRDRIVRLLFNSLLTDAPRVVRASKSGLQAVLLQEKLTKELVTECLRPILLEVADFRLLTPKLLDKLKRTLELLSKAFNDSVAQKLLEHLDNFTDEVKLRAMRADATNLSASLQRPEVERHVTTAIVEVFHLLPTPKDSWQRTLERLVGSQLKLGHGERAHMALFTLALTGINSPTWKPLIKFLDANAAQTATYFLRRLTHDRCASFLLLRDSHFLPFVLDPQPSQGCRVCSSRFCNRQVRKAVSFRQSPLS
jgi:hypothetical protein